MRSHTSVERISWQLLPRIPIGRCDVWLVPCCPKICSDRCLDVGCLAVLVAAVAFRAPLFELVRRWTVQEEYSHGFLIPIVAALLVWTRRNIILASFGSPSWIGVFILLLAMFIHLTGLLSAIFILSQLAFIVALLGILISIGGFSLLGTTFFPVIFLAFAIPLPYFIDATLSLSNCSSFRRSSAFSSSGCFKSRSIWTEISLILATTSSRSSTPAADCGNLFPLLIAKLCWRPICSTHRSLATRSGFVVRVSR